MTSTREIFPTASYKGTRDFYPDEYARHNYIFETWAKVMRRYGFEQYDTSILENAHLYIAKSGSELGGSQLYNFYDKGNRFVALRPEMTPSLARIVAHKFNELRYPLRWFSIPNCFRYERPQKGRLREHWQLNADIIGLEAGEGEVEILSLVGAMFKEFGATQSHFKILYNHRKLLDLWLVKNDIHNTSDIYPILDDWFKIDEDTKQELLANVVSPLQAHRIINLANQDGEAWSEYQELALEFEELRLIKTLLPIIHPDLEYELNPCIIRGIAYYTGVVYEAFDKNPTNPRALFGGGRYDDLLGMFDKSMPAIGYGCGDVTMDEFLTNHSLWPKNMTGDVQKVGIIPYSRANLEEIYSTITPSLTSSGQIFDIDYSYSRSENKRYETLKKRGCHTILKVGFES